MEDGFDSSLNGELNETIKCDGAPATTTALPTGVGQPALPPHNSFHNVQQEFIYAVNLHLPQFSPESPDIWFAIGEADFAANRITSDAQRYNQLLKALPLSIASQLIDIINNAPSQDKYKTLKFTILERFSESRQKQLQKLLKEKVLGTKKPSQLLREMRELAKNSVTDEVLHQLWTERLPERIRPLLVISDNLHNLNALAETADRIMEALGGPSVMAVQNRDFAPRTNQNHNPPDLTHIERQLLEMRLMLECCQQDIKGLQSGQQQLQHQHHQQRSQVQRPRTRSVTPNRNGKLNELSLIGAVGDSVPDTSFKEIRLHILDSATNKTFLIDSGSVVSIIPSSFFKIKPDQEQLTLYAANSSAIHTYGYKNLTLDLNLRRAFPWTFVIADIQTAILGADFLTHYNLLVDLKHQRLIDALTNLSSKGESLATKTYNISTLDTSLPEPYVGLLREFIKVTTPTYSPNFNNRQFAHRIITKGPPVSARARKLAGEKSTAAKAHISEMLGNGIIRPSRSPYASPIHLVRKKNNDWRLCGDYRQLNADTVADKYAPPLIQDLFLRLHGNCIFTKLDMDRAYHQVPMHPEDIHKTAIITPFGLFEYLVMPFGLRNATQTFQRFMDSIFRDLDFVYVYIDDILIMSRDKDQHESHLRIVFERLQASSLSISLKKCVFGQSELNFLGFTINAQGYAPVNERVEAILNFKKPESIEELRRFLGVTNYYRRFIPNAASSQLPLNGYLQRSIKNDKTKVHWTDTATKAFEECKQKIANATLLAYPSPEAAMTLTTDASSTAIGAKLEQLVDGTWKPLGFFSRKLSSGEQGYCTYDRELLAIFASIQFFHHMLECRNFTIKTDHKPLIYAFKQKHEKAPERRLRQLDYISQYCIDIVYLKGEDNIVADALSRVNTINMPTIFSPARIRDEQLNDDHLQELIQSSSLHLQKLQAEPGIKIYCDISTGIVRPYIPLTLRRTAFNTIHNIAHPSGRSTSHLLREKFIWPGIRKDALQWSRECTDCQRTKIHRHNKLQPDHIIVPDSRFNHIHIDIISLPCVEGFQYCLTMIDRFSRWPVAVPIKDMTADTVATNIFNHWISHYGSPVTITSDQGSQFESALFKALTNLVGAQKTRTTSYHPQSNGLVERMHRTLKAALMCSPKPWLEILPTILLGLRTSFKEDIQSTPAEMLYGTCLRVPGEFFVSSDLPADSLNFIEKHREYMRGMRPTQTAHHNKNRIFILKDLNTCSHVWLRCDHVKSPLEPPYQGPYKVIQRLSDRIYKIELNGVETNVSIERLKPCYINKTDEDLTEETPEPNYQQTQPHHWTSSMDPPQRTYGTKRSVTFLQPSSQSHSRGSKCGDTVSMVAPLPADTRKEHQTPSPQSTQSNRR